MNVINDTKLEYDLDEPERENLGRVSILTLDPKVKQTIIEHVEKGNYIDDACLAVGISERMFYVWIDLANKDIAEGKTVENSPYISLLHDLKRAHARATVRLMNDIDKSETRDQQWTNKAWILERTRNRKFGQRQLIELDTDPMTANLDIPSAHSAPKPLSGWIAEHKRIDSVTPDTDIDLDAIEQAEVVEANDLQEINTEENSSQNDS